MTTLRPETLTGWDRSLIIEQPEGPARAMLAGTGLDVFEVFSAYRSADEDWEDLRGWFDWLSAEQLRAVLGFCYEHLPALEERLEAESDENVQAQMEEMWRKHPHTKPPHLRSTD